VPALSTLARFEQEHAERLARVRRRYLVALALTFVVGIAAGAAARTPTLASRLMDSSVLAQLAREGAQHEHWAATKLRAMSNP
jgi:hypothetical protein